jgi:hypothetical protein
LTPHEFFGIAFWIGFVLQLIAAEAYIHVTSPLRHIAPAQSKAGVGHPSPLNNVTEGSSFRAKRDSARLRSAQ